MLIQDLVKLEIEKTQKEIERLKELLPKVSGEDLKVCPCCKTKNYRFFVKTGNWACQFC